MKRRVLQLEFDEMEVTLELLRRMIEATTDLYDQIDRAYWETGRSDRFCLNEDQFHVLRYFYIVRGVFGSSAAERLRKKMVDLGCLGRKAEARHRERPSKTMRFLYTANNGGQADENR